MKRRRRAITLIEILIVIALIAVIGSALAVNMRGSLDKGRAFKSKQNSERIINILEMARIEGDHAPDYIASEWRNFVTKDPTVKASEVMKDGWGAQFDVKYVASRDEFVVTSHKLNQYIREHEEHLKKAPQEGK